MITKIKKRDGVVVDFDAEKLNKWADWSAGIGVEWGSVALGACRKCFDGCTTDDLHSALIAECVDRETTAHLRMAGRLFIGMVYKKVFGDWREIPKVAEMYTKMVAQGLWEDMGYSAEELGECDGFINHELDMNATLTESKQIMDKYAITDRVDKHWYESPQVVYMRMALGNMKDMPKERRMKDVQSLYYGYSRKLINPPTPFSINLGTPKRQYASCCVVTTKDTAASIAAADHIAYMMTCASAGIGMHLKTRSKGDKVRGGAIQHQGKLPYYKVQEKVVAANLQSCYSDDTEILTQRGFILFKDLLEDDWVSQVANNGDVSFIKPLRLIADSYKGDMYTFKSDRNTGLDICVTPNHRMLWKKQTKSLEGSRASEKYLKNGWKASAKHYVVDGKRSETLAENLNPKREMVFDFGGNAIGMNDNLCDKVKLAIAYQADGLTKPAGNFAYSFRFTKERKIIRLRELLTRLGISFSEIVQKTGVTSFYAKVGYELKKDFSWLDLRFRSHLWFKEFLKEVALWDGCLTVDSSKDAMTFCTTEKSVMDVVQAAAALCGAYSHVKYSGDYQWGKKSENVSEIYNVYISFDKKSTTGRDIIKEVSQYDGIVYCVEVPTGAVIIRRNGKTSVCGNSRGGANTMHFNVLDPELMDLLKLKNVQTVTDKRIKDIDYSWGSNALFAQKVAKNEQWMLVSYAQAPDLYEAMYKGDQSDFDRLYAEVESDDTIVKQFVSARAIAIEALKEGYETGRMYLHFTDEMNRHSPFKDTIYSSNLCVAPETTIFTDKGHKVICDFEDKAVNVWNGFEFSSVTVRKTSEWSELITVSLSDGRSIECTGDHKFYAAKGYTGGRVEVAAKNLLCGDKLIKLVTPVVQGSKDLDKAYSNGFFSGDGCEVSGHSRVYLYKDKQKLRHLFTDTYTETVQDGRTYFYVKGLEAKFFVPDSVFTVEARINWLAGLLDSDGCVTNNKGAQSLQVVSSEVGFLENVQEMLQTLGVQSKVVFAATEGMKSMPANDGTGSKREYYCRSAKRLLITASGIVKLRGLGLLTHRLVFEDGVPDRECSAYVKVVSVTRNGRFSPTYCFTEPKRNMGVFNGILTGQCQEIALPTGGYDSVADLYKE